MYELSLLDEPLVDGDVEELVVALQPGGEHRLGVLGGLRGRQLVGVGQRRRAGRLGHEGGVAEAGKVAGARVENDIKRLAWSTELYGSVILSLGARIITSTSV